MTQRKVLVLTTPQSFDELDATDIPALAYDASGAAASAASGAASALSTHAGAADPHTGYALESALGTAAAANTGDFDAAGAAAARAPSDATYLVTAANASLSAEVVVPAAVLSVLDDTTVAAMVDTLGGASSTGTGGLVRATSPTLVTPALGTPASGVATNLTGTAASLTAGNVTTNANLTGDVTSSGNATTLATVPVAKGGTGAVTASAARVNLGLALGHQSGRYYGCMCSSTTNNQAVTLNVLYAAPFFAPISRAYDRIGIAVPVTVATSLIRLGIYADSSGKPGALILDAGTVSGNGGGQTDITINQTLSGIYWLCMVGQTAAPQAVHATGINNLFGGLGTTSGYSLSIVGSYSQTGITGALPDPWGATFTETQRMPIVYLRAT